MGQQWDETAVMTAGTVGVPPASAGASRQPTDPRDSDAVPRGKSATTLKM